MSEMSMTRVGETEVVVTRYFNASPEQVFAAHTDADLLRKWMLGPEGWTMPKCVSDPVAGGELAFTWANEAGESFSLVGQYLTLEPPRKIVHRERFLDMDVMSDTEVTTEFEPSGSGTKLTLIIHYESPEARERALSTGMEDGMAQSYGKLDELNI